MSVGRAIVLAVLGVAWVAGFLLLPPAVATWLVPASPAQVPAGATAHSRSVPSTAVIVPSLPLRTGNIDLDAPKRLDVHGNEIARPVARYRVDTQGTLYEVHSPQTEVPRLRPPRL